MGVRVSQVKAMKLFQITPCVNHFQTLNNLGSRQPVGASKNSLLPFIFDISLSSFDDAKRAELSNNSFE